MPSRCGTFVIAVCALSFTDAFCQPSNQSTPGHDSDQPQTYQSVLLGVSFTYPRSMVSVHSNRQPAEDVVPEMGVKDRADCVRSIGDDIVAVRNMRTDDPESLKRFPPGSEGARALANEEYKWPGIVARLSILHLGLTCMPGDIYSHLVNSEYEYLPGAVERVGLPGKDGSLRAMHFYGPDLLKLGDTTAMFTAAEFSKPDARDGRYWLAKVSFISNGYIVEMEMSSNDHDFFKQLLNGTITIGESPPSPLVQGEFYPDKAATRLLEVIQ